MRTKKFGIKMRVAEGQKMWLAGLTKDNAICISGPSSDHAKRFYDAPDALAYWEKAFPDHQFNEDHVSIVDITERQMV